MKKSIFTTLFFLTLFLGGNITNAQKVVVINKHNRHQVIKIKPNKPKLIIVKPNKVRRNHVWVKGYWRWNFRKHRYVWVKGYWKRKKRNHI